MVVAMDAARHGHRMESARGAFLQAHVSAIVAATGAIVNLGF